MDKPKFSFIMPVYNDAKTVERAVESILDQDIKEVEVILVNDGSTDDSAIRIFSLVAMHGDRVKSLQFTENKGACIARNEGAKMATGKYFAWLPADAKLYPGMLRIWFDALEENPQFDFVYGGYRITDENYNAIQGGDFLFEPFDPYMLEVTNYIDGSFPMRADVYWKICKEKGLDGLWDPAVKSLQDWDFWLTVVKSGSKGHYVRDIFFETTMPHKGGLSDDSNNNWLERTNFIKKKHGISNKKVCVSSLGANWHARNVAKMIGADFKEMPSFKPHEYHAIYLIGFYPEFAVQQDQMFLNSCYDVGKGRTAAKKVVHFVGSDVWQLYHVSTMSLKVWRDYFSNMDALLCESPFIKAELEELGIHNVQIVPIPPLNLYEVMPLPKDFTVAVYTPAVNADFYHPAQMEEIAKKMPDVKFKFFGNPYRKGVREGEQSNIEDMGYMDYKDMKAFTESCSAIMRFPKHDGLPLSVLEFLTAGRYSLQSVPVDYTSFLPISTFTVDAAVEGLKQIRERATKPNEEASKYWREKLDHQKFADTINKICGYDPKEYWENRAERWTHQAAGMTVETDEVKKMYEEAVKEIGHAPSVVDMGCGDGRWLPKLKEWGMQSYIGFDISEKLVDAAKKNFPENNFFASKVEDMGKLEKCDLGFSYTTLEHITAEEFPKAVEAIKKSVKWLLLIEPTGFISRYYCHNHDYAKHFTVVKEVQLADKKILLCKIQE